MYMCLYIYICIYVKNICACPSYLCTYMHIYIYIHTCIYVCIYVFYVHMQTYIHIHTYINIYIYMYTILYTCIYIHIHMYIYIYIVGGSGLSRKTKQTFGVFSVTYIYIYSNTSGPRVSSQTGLMCVLYMYMCLYIIYLKGHLKIYVHVHRMCIHTYIYV